MYYGHQPATHKQIGYAGYLARQLGKGNSYIELLCWANNWSRSKASKKASKETISEAIDAALTALKRK